MVLDTRMGLCFHRMKNRALTTFWHDGGGTEEADFCYLLSELCERKIGRENI